MKIDNVDKEVLDIIEKRDCKTQPSDILKVLDKKPQAVSRSLKKLLKFGSITATRGKDKRKIFYKVKENV